MNIYRCTHLLKDSYGRLIGFRLVNNIETINITENDLYNKMNSCDIVVSNLELTKFNTISYNKNELNEDLFPSEQLRIADTKDNELNKLLNKATILGMSVEVITTLYESKYYIISGSNNNIVYIPDDVTHISKLSSLTGYVTIIGGKGLFSLSDVFKNCEFEILDLRKLNTRNVSDMTGAFSYSTIKQIVFGEDWYTGNVVSMTSMFEHCETSSLDLSTWDVSRVLDMTRMFLSFKAKTLNLKWNNTAKLTGIRTMFWNCDVEKLDLTHINVGRIKDFSGVFTGCKAKQININGWKTNEERVYYTKLFMNCNAELICDNTELLKQYKDRIIT